MEDSSFHIPPLKFRTTGIHFLYLTFNTIESNKAVDIATSLPFSSTKQSG